MLAKKTKLFISGILISILFITISIIFSNSLIASPQNRALYVWNSYDIIHNKKEQDKFFTFIDSPLNNKSYAPDVLFVYMDLNVFNQIKVDQFIQRAHNKGLLVHALGGQKDWVASKDAYKKGKTYCNSISTYNQQHIKRSSFDGVQLYMAIHEIKNKLEKADTIMSEYKKVLNTCTVELSTTQGFSQNKIQLGILMHAGWDSIFKNTAFNHRKLIDMSDYVSIMTFGEDEQTIYQHVISKIWHAQAREKDVYIAVWVDDLAPYANTSETITFFQEGSLIMEKVLNKVYNRFIDVNRLKGFAILSYSGYKNLTVKPLDITAPSILEVSPAGSASTDQKVTISFSEKLDTSSITEHTISLIAQNNKKINGTLKYEDKQNKIMFIPEKSLEYGQLYTVKIKSGDNGVLDSRGNPLEKDFVWNFNVDRATNMEPPTAIGEANTYYVNTITNITLDGSQSFDPQNRPLKYSWRQISGHDVKLINENTAQAKFKAPANTADTLTFEFIVDNGLEVSPKIFVDVVIDTKSKKTIQQKKLFFKSSYKKLLGYNPNKQTVKNIEKLTPSEIIKKIVYSPEYNKKTISKLYKRFLKRDAEPEGGNVWLHRFASGVKIRPAIIGFVSSREYNQTYKNNQEYVQSLYLNILNRPADKVGLNYWINKLNNESSRKNVAYNLVYSREFNNKFVTKMYAEINNSTIKDKQKENIAKLVENPQTDIRQAIENILLNS